MAFAQGRFAISFVTAASLLMASLPIKSSAQGDLDQPIGATEAGTRELTPYWTEGLNALLEIYCLGLRCEAERLEDDTQYIFELANVELPATLLAVESIVVVRIETIRAAISKDGVTEFNGFPASIEITASGITLNDEGILEITAALFKDDPLLQRLIAREVAKEGLSFSAHLRRGEGRYRIDFSVELLSGDKIQGSLTALSTSSVLAYLMKDVITAAELSEIEDEAVRGALLFDSIEWRNLIEIPISEASIQLTEVTLLDKIFGPFLIAKKSNGERGFWESVQALAVPVVGILNASSRFGGGEANILGAVDFYSNWRSKQGNLAVSIGATNIAGLRSGIALNGFNPEQEGMCKLEATLLPFVFAGFGAILPYYPNIQENLDSEVLQRFVTDEGFAGALKNTLDGFAVETFTKFRCSTGGLTFAYQAGE